ncbi:MAG TPA: DUF4232 domain-containing protein [Chloroflexota bacterium]|nr:DUF4232 domain-containing protein [Chloroflexota bacterium]
MGLLAGLAMLLCTTGAAAARQGGCAFALGFAVLHDLVPDVVGGCIEDEHHDPLSGDALQQTSNGLLVWRKLDNWTAFTNGSETWVNGPLSLQQRRNDQRFWWEANPDALAIVPTPGPGERCHTAGLSLELVGVDAGAGNFVGTFYFRNTLGVSCTFFGFPGAQLIDTAQNPVPTRVVRGGGYFTNNPPPRAVDVAPGAAALFRIHWEQVPVGNETTCSMASSIAITPPDEYVSLHVRVEIRACGGGNLNVSAVQSDTP